MARKFKVGDEVRIQTAVVNSDYNGAIGSVTGAEAGGYWVYVNELGEHFASPQNLELLPMTSRPSYIAGVNSASARRLIRERLVADRLQAFSAWGQMALVPSLEAASLRAEANRTKYATQATMTVKFTPVAKGSEPIRVNKSGKSRQAYRLDTLFAKQRGFDSWEAYEADYIARGRKEA